MAGATDPRPPAGQHGAAREDQSSNTPDAETEGAPPHDSGSTRVARNEQPSHPLVHHRDESTSTQEGGPSGTGRQARQDAEQGLADTSRAETTDDTYAREFRSDPTQTPPERHPPPGARH